MKVKDFIRKPYFKLKILATLFDYGIFMFLFWLFVDTFGIVKPDGSKEVTGELALVIPIFWFLYFVGTESLNQATPGHDIFKLRVLKSNGRRIEFMDALKRRICDPIDILFYGIPAFICIKKTEKCQRIGDLLADTIVVKVSDIPIVKSEIVYDQETKF